MTCKVIRVTKEGAVLGFMDGKFKIVAFKDLGFVPEVNESIEIYVNGSQTVYVKKESLFSSNSLNTMFGGKRRVNKITYCLLCFFLGGIGVHKFYCGKTALGIIYVVFCWTFIPAIVSFIEGCIAITQTSDSRGNIIV